MSILVEASIRASELGFKKGESAKQWQARNPEAAKQYAMWIKQNIPGLVAATKKCAS